ncbi:uncharacterized protein LOC111798649 isoform X1 [Cucurbita pepo subsp. pepo]|uniref:Uncharacterized protein LOC111443991 isoform X1 n=1 Tax=Cucurbita moschata TaxID=3662 RepID=A0A6J1FBT3_CUCMO|nr:uncharacterized protein LOC111443991 isoform X1 [Cucurbita moschata]XP_022937650.1 uncharacterized protein LOC111443991 isoform X1 [Cucurbita moschata]XP_023537695.1 uncharacterized protein LOC111798649 isoform X1 [Cucurbita pepo subsp. pepo]
MSAIVCGKRSLFEDLPTPPVSKRIRCSSSSPVRFSPPRSSNQSAFPFPPTSSSQSAHLVDYLSAIFPDMDKQLLERALEECGDDLDLAIRSLNQLHLGYNDRNLGSSSNTSDVALEANIQPQSQAETQGEAAIAEEATASENLPTNGAEWVELFVREMTSASNMDDARSRASRVLEVLEKSICARANAEAANNFQQENKMLREQVEALIQENTILKRAVSIQHERQKEYEGRNQELQHLKELVAQYQEQLKTLEVNNYALTMHLKQAQQSSSIPGRFHPDVF